MGGPTRTLGAVIPQGGLEISEGGEVGQETDEEILAIEGPSSDPHSG